MYKKERKYMEIFVIPIAIIIKIALIRYNKKETIRYLQNKLYTVVQVKWAPFGYGWFGEKNASIFSVSYKDQEGNLHHAFIKSGLFGGIYIGKDRTVKYAS